MIIGLGHRMGTGKNTVASIIQYLNIKKMSYERLRTIKEVPSALENFDSNISYYQSDWRQHSFAWTLKEIASNLTGLPLETFCTQEGKQSELPPEWNIKVGDNYVPMTVRQLLQKLGTDAIRNNVHQDAWVNALMVEYRPSYKWCITDVRFPNEANAIKAKGGVMINVGRNCAKCGAIFGHKMDCSAGITEHLSEYALDGYTGWDYMLKNDGTIEDLVVKVEEMIKILNIKL